MKEALLAILEQLKAFQTTYEDSLEQLGHSVTIVECMEGLTEIGSDMEGEDQGEGQ